MSWLDLGGEKIIEIMLSSIIKKFEQKCLKIYYKP